MATVLRIRWFGWGVETSSGARLHRASRPVEFRKAAGERMALELWGGHEPTVNRVGDAFFDQTLRSGHEQRDGDIALFAELGIKALRYPVLWEKISPLRAEDRDFPMIRTTSRSASCEP